MASARDEGMSKRARVCETSVEISKNDPLNDLIKLNVGGVNYTTTRKTLLSLKNTWFSKVFDPETRFKYHPKDDQGAYFIDRDGKYFQYILNFLRNPVTFEIPDDPDTRKYVKIEADYYGVSLFPPQVNNGKEAFDPKWEPKEPLSSYMRLKSSCILAHVTWSFPDVDKIHKQLVEIEEANHRAKKEKQPLPFKETRLEKIGTWKQLTSNDPKYRYRIRFKLEAFLIRFIRPVQPAEDEPDQTSEEVYYTRIQQYSQFWHGEHTKGQQESEERFQGKIFARLGDKILSTQFDDADIDENTRVSGWKTAGSWQFPAEDTVLEYLPGNDIPEAEYNEAADVEGNTISVTLCLTPPVVEYV